MPAVEMSVRLPLNGVEKLLFSVVFGAWLAMKSSMISGGGGIVAADAAGTLMIVGATQARAPAATPPPITARRVGPMRAAATIPVLRATSRRPSLAPMVGEPSGAAAPPDQAMIARIVLLGGRHDASGP